MFFTRCKFYPHKYNSIVITIPIVYGFFLSIVITIPSIDGFFFYFSTFKFPSINSGYQAEFNPRPLPVFLLLSLPRARAYIFLHPGSYVFEFHRQSHGQYQASPLPSLVGRKQ